MKVQTNYGHLPKMNDRHAVKGNDVSFKSVYAYAPRCYREVRNISNAISKNSERSQKLLLFLYEHRGENLNNALTAAGTAFVAPFFIRYNPFSREDTDSREYSAWRQPISAGITWGGQYFLVGAYNRLLEKHAAELGVDSMDLRAKPPESYLEPKAKNDYKNYKAECIRNGTAYEDKKSWIRNRIVELQDEAFYSELNKYRKTMDVSNLSTKDIVKSSDINKGKDKVFKEVLRDQFGFKEDEFSSFKKFEDFIDKGKKLAKSKKLDFAIIEETITDRATELAVDNLEKTISFETDVKHKTSLIYQEMNNKLNAEKVKIMGAESAQAGKTGATILKSVEKKVDAAAETIYKATIDSMKPQYDEIMAIPEANRTREQAVFELAYKKVLKQGSLKNIKFHGQTRAEVERSVKIKKWLIAKINNSESKLKVWKDKSGIVFGLGVLFITCTVLNWAYPKIMKKAFPRLSAIKEAKKAELKEQRQAELAQQADAKEVK